MAPFIEDKPYSAPVSLGGFGRLEAKTKEVQRMLTLLRKLIKRRRMKVINVSNHTKKHISGTIVHQAVVKIERYKPSDMQVVASIVSQKVGYHPVGYGLYNDYTLIAPRGEGEYDITWVTGAYCD